MINNYDTPRLGSVLSKGQQKIGFLFGASKINYQPLKN